MRGTTDDRDIADDLAQAVQQSGRIMVDGGENDHQFWIVADESRLSRGYRRRSRIPLR
ncbi:MAG TPA: hypothetical protein VH333_02940 [Pseudonocardiaceae bacterium]|nr:hypothetical protein [Pseudonocardiaceae bacterium]